MRLALLLCLFLSACQNYDVTVNDRLVYGPVKPFNDFEVPDAALQQCLTQRIVDEGVSDPLDLRILNCSSAGIASLQGLGLFAALQQLKFSDNRIRNLVELGQLNELEVIWLDGNDVIDPVPLVQLRKLRQVDLSGNTDLQCPRSGAFSSVDALTLPKHCGALPATHP